MIFKILTQIQDFEIKPLENRPKSWKSKCCQKYWNANRQGQTNHGCQWSLPCRCHVVSASSWGNIAGMKNQNLETDSKSWISRFWNTDSRFSRFWILFKILVSEIKISRDELALGLFHLHTCAIGHRVSSVCVQMKFHILKQCLDFQDFGLAFKILNSKSWKLN